MSRRLSVTRTFTVAAPLVLATVELFHPHPHDLLQLDLRRWMAVHYAQLALFPLAALAESELVSGIPGLAASLCRAAMFVFAVCYVAFDTAAGIVTGVLALAAAASGVPEGWRPPIEAIWNHAVVGGSNDGTPLLAVAGTMAWLAGTLAAAVAIHGAKRSRGTVIALIVSALGLLVFRTHAWPGGPVTFAALALAAALTWRSDAKATMENSGIIHNSSFITAQ